jgi:hypothetical protein
MTKFIYYDKKCHDGLKKKKIIAFDAATKIYKNNALT